MKTIIDDMAANEQSISETTINSYLNALRRIFVVEDLPAWSPALRSKTAIRLTAKRHFVDPSIAVTALRTAPEGLLADFNTFGLLFESICVRDIRIYAQANDGDVYHYRDKSDFEADIIVALHDGRWGGAIEVKMGEKEIDMAAANLLKLKNEVNVEKMHEPSFLMVLTASEYCYQREDGVYVIPVGCLRE